MVQFARPDGDDVTNNWTTTPLWSKLDDNDDADFVRSENDPANDLFRCTLDNSITDPGVSTGHVVRCRMRKQMSGGGAPGQIDIVVRLKKSDTTVVASGTFTDVGTDWITNSFTLTTGEADSITDYTDLLVEVDANKSGGARTSWGECAWAELQVPDAGWDPSPYRPAGRFHRYGRARFRYERRFPVHLLGVEPAVAGWTPELLRERDLRAYYREARRLRGRFPEHLLGIAPAAPAGWTPELRRRRSVRRYYRAVLPVQSSGVFDVPVPATVEAIVKTEKMYVQRIYMPQVKRVVIGGGAAPAATPVISRPNRQHVAPQNRVVKRPAVVETTNVQQTTVVSRPSRPQPQPRQEIRPKPDVIVASTPQPITRVVVKRNQQWSLPARQTVRRPVVVASVPQALTPVVAVRRTQTRAPQLHYRTTRNVTASVPQSLTPVVARRTARHAPQYAYLPRPKAIVQTQVVNANTIVLRKSRPIVPPYFHTTRRPVVTASVPQSIVNVVSRPNRIHHATQVHQRLKRSAIVGGATTTNVVIARTTRPMYSPARLFVRRPVVSATVQNVTNVVARPNRIHSVAHVSHRLSRSVVLAAGATTNVVSRPNRIHHALQTTQRIKKAVVVSAAATTSVVIARPVRPIVTPPHRSTNRRIVVQQTVQNVTNVIARPRRIAVQSAYAARLRRFSLNVVVNQPAPVIKKTQRVM